MAKTNQAIQTPPASQDGASSEEQGQLLSSSSTEQSASPSSDTNPSSLDAGTDLPPPATPPPPAEQASAVTLWSFRVRVEINLDGTRVVYEPLSGPYELTQEQQQELSAYIVAVA